MNEIIKIEARQLAGATVQTTNARDLWVFLESKQHFADWIKGRIEKFEFVEGVDFTVHKFMNGRATVTDYHLTIDMAKELAMVENNDKGREVRRYFIECERLAKSAQPVDPMAALADPAAMRGLLLTYTEKVLTLQGEVATMAPKVAALDRIATSDGSMCITDAAKTLQIQPRKLTQLLQEQGWVYRRPMGSGWLAYQDRIQQGLMEHKVTTGEKGDGHEWTNTQARITPKGLTKLATVIRQAGTH